ncbi:S-adenosyl-L-methionine-dependent methyltransferase [Gigaspora rosea]|uniref:S-adenosyl-L-methionine-dependent methyltransferase n=1 Tax=Gigaspora rosea TaxID=44941 RepID=A0A397VZ76_9GLOM|nr:S-adenosyl-L-methionine-dependent methyltransferase [Gigaspora rosea]
MLKSRKPSKNSFRYSDGRRFHNDTKYIMPNDDEEVDRLQMQHFLYRNIWNGNYSAPVTEFLERGNCKVLDVGCGPGTWLLDMSTTYQGSTFIGIDISPIFPTGIKPPNLTFYATNVLKGLPFPDNHFDFVYMRNLIIAFTEDEWNTVIGELIRVVKPGGWIELMEGNLEFEGEGACAQVLLGAFRSILRSNSMNPKICSQIYTFLSTSPLLKSFSFKEKLIPIGKWAGKIGEIASQDFCSLFLAVRGAICRVLEDERVIKGCSCGIKECHVGNEVFDKDGKNLCDHENRWNEEYAELVKEIARECNEEKANYRHYRFFAQKI